MRSTNYQFPLQQTLMESIVNILSDYYALDIQVTILAREANYLASTFPSEIVTCQLADGRTFTILCKYGDGQNSRSYGHQNGLSYETKVYRYVLQPLQVSSPTFYGAIKNSISGETLLILEYFDKSILVKNSSDLNVLQAAANWLGSFHRLNESLLASDSLSFLNKYDSKYYLGWAERTSLFAGHLHQRFPWLSSLCKLFDKIVDTILNSPLVIIHGEYYTNNIILWEGEIYPIDWESAAIAIGEIDLASLIEKWPTDYQTVAIDKYQKARWPEGSPDDFEYKLNIAKIYWHLRWLGDRPEWTTNENDRWRFEELRLIGERLGLI